ncbi:MAG TPA: hypothetical protein VM223_19850 [Planctomycetota bacterium]|nr:hypothetical protein [Planctomycetota bacterium]
METIREQLGVTYQKVLVPVNAGVSPALRDAASGAVFPVQRVPAMPFDRVNAEQADVVLVDLAPGAELNMEPADAPAAESPIRIEAAAATEREGSQLAIVNGRFAVRLPADGQYEQPLPGPIAGIRIDGGDWFGQNSIVDANCRGAVQTEIESLGPCCVQWRTTCRWGNDAAFTFRARWAAGADVIQIVETMSESTDAAVEWFPYGSQKAQSYVWGGGERKGPMQPLRYESTGTVNPGHGRRILQHLSHIGYWNQWNLCRVGFTADDDRFVGIFSAHGSLWQRRGLVRVEINEDDDHGHFVRFPLKQGRRLYGLLLSTKAEAGVDAKDSRCLLNRRKVQLSDLALAKVRHWELNPPLDDRKPNLMRQADLDTFRARLALDPAIGKTFEAYVGQKQTGYAGQLAVALTMNDSGGMQACVQPILAAARKMLTDIADGGYERLIIFDGRQMKRLAYDLDVLWALGLIDEQPYRAIRTAFLAVGGYMFSDPDYCNYGDFWPNAELDEGIASALKDDMGDCPVPPNFASEFMSTVGVMAELFEKHPMHQAWRQWTMQQTDRFHRTFYEHDGTYHESVNYHTHEFSERILFLYPLWWKGVRDYFADERVKGTIRHSVEIQMPPLSDSIEPLTGPCAGRYGSIHTLYADWSLPRRAVHPADGNSGGHGHEQEQRGEYTLGAWIYRESDPALAAACMRAWRLAGKPIPLHTHPVLTVGTIDPAIESGSGAGSVQTGSTHRVSMGLISKAHKKDGSPLWCLFRAGKATHHMDFDQGNLHLAAWDSVLLGEHGYHTNDNAGNNIGGADTWLHNTVVYSDDKWLSSGYAGLERAPDPIIVHMGDTFDWCAVRIVNTNVRPLRKLSYKVMLPVPTTRHLRHYLFVKPDYFLVWDVFEEAHSPSTFWLHPGLPVRDEGSGIFRAGEPGKPHLLVRFLLPEAPQVIENEQFGPLWSLGVRNDTGKPYMALLVPQVDDLGITAELGDDGKTITVAGSGIKDEIRLPEAGSVRELPIVVRRR